jgi:type III pantothenate kinase
MDINLLVLSVGNSRLALGTFIAGELTQTLRIEHGDKRDLVGLIKNAWEPLKEGSHLFLRKGDGNGSGARAAIEAAPSSGGVAVVGLSVNPAVKPSIEQAVEGATGQAVRWIGRDIDLPIPVLTDDPGKTGVDRVVNVAAAYEQIGKACIVVDAGTAITVDCCNEKGEFLGGSIAPGVAMMLDALHNHTASLPRVSFAKEDLPVANIGRSTEAAIRSGVFHSIRGMVKELAEAYATEIGTWPEVIATGGDASLLFDGWELIHAIAPDLTLYGAALAYTEHHIKHGT